MRICPPSRRACLCAPAGMQRRFTTRACPAPVTLDLDFADVRHYPPGRFAGLIVIRLGRNSRQAVLHTVERIIGLLERQSVGGQPWMVEPDRVRMREGRLGREAGRVMEWQTCMI